MPGFDDDQLLRSLEEWNAERRHDDARCQRVEQRWQRSLAGEEMRFSGIVLDLAESRSPVRVITRSGRSHTGIVAIVGSDFCAIAKRERPTVVLALAAITAFEVKSGGRAPVGSGREIGGEQTIEDVLLQMLEVRALLRVVVSGSSEVKRCSVAAVGDDVVAFEVEDQKTLLFVPTSDVNEVWIET